MLLQLIKKEIISHVLTLRFAVTFVLILLLVFGGAYVTSSQYLQRLQQPDVIEREARKAYDQGLAEAEKDDGDSWERVKFFWRGKLDPVPRAPLSSVVLGLSDETPDVVLTSAHWQRNVSKAQADNPHLGLYHAPDFAYVVSVVLSLLALLFVFDTICGEKEGGTLRLMLSNSVPRHTVLLAKWIGGYIILCAPLIVAFLGTMVYGWTVGSLEFSGDNVVRLGLLLALALLYTSVFFTLGLFVSTTTHRSSTSLFICLFIWVGWILVVPNLAPVMAKIISPAPSKQKINEEKEALQRETWMRMGRLQMVAGELNYSQKLQDERQKLEAEMEAGLARWDRYYDQTKRRQGDWAAGLGRVSPSASWVYAAAALTQTGPESYRRFLKSRQRLEDDLEKLYRETREEARKTRDDRGWWSWPVVDYDQIPRFHVSPPSLDDSVYIALNDVLLLAIFNVVFFMASFLFFLRYDVR